MEHVYEENKIPQLARTNRVARLPIIILIELKLLFGGNPQGIKSFLSNHQWQTDITNRFNRVRLMMKMVYYRYAYEVSYKEFYSYRLEQKTKKECLEYFPSYEKMRLYDEVVCTNPLYDTFLNKYKTYEMFKPYFKRDLKLFDDIDLETEFFDFYNSHKKIVLKTINENGGKGVSVLDDSYNILDLHRIFQQMISKGAFLAEEYVNQCEELSSFHQHSVNTLRLTTYYNEGELTKLYAMVRFGNNGSIVDNAGAGGYCANVDLDTGVIISDGFSMNGEKIEFHPDSKKRFLSTQLPRWDELNKMVGQIVKVCPNQHYIGWDFACTEDKGWMIIEANAGPGLEAAQACGGGLRAKLAKTLFKESSHCKDYTSAKL